MNVTQELKFLTSCQIASANSKDAAMSHWSSAAAKYRNQLLHSNITDSDAATAVVNALAQCIEHIDGSPQAESRERTLDGAVRALQILNAYGKKIESP